MDDEKITNRPTEKYYTTTELIFLLGKFTLLSLCIVILFHFLNIIKYKTFFSILLGFITSFFLVSYYLYERDKYMSKFSYCKGEKL